MLHVAVLCDIEDQIWGLENSRYVFCHLTHSWSLEDSLGFSLETITSSAN